MTKVSPKRHIAKTITWRIIGTLDTILISWFISGSITAGLSIGASELITKIVLYYVHERLWYTVKALQGHSRLRHVLKTITWRFIGTTDTIILGWLITGRADYGLSIGGIELVSKMVLYYLHERLWYRSDFGVIKATNKNMGNGRRI